MVFSSVSFLFFFLPLLILIYFLVPKSWRNTILLLFSLLFYFFGEKWYVLLLIFSCFINYICALFVNDEKKRKVFLLVGLAADLGMLFYFKYVNFFLDTFNNFFGLNIGALKVILPLGISFFTFQNIGYLIDVYRKDVKAENNFWRYLTYIALFPQLVAGPIVRYRDVCKQLVNRKENIKLFASGVQRFVIGLAKKVLIADVIYGFAIKIMNVEMSMLSYWLVAFMFTFQIYYDFSGYSDMAIGLGRMFGFEFLENFNYPLIAKSITEFWRRWHMSLSSFFRDYVYIPLGGNRCSVLRNVFNIFVVWFLTGLWHGADWNFILWGIYFFIFLVIEKFVIKGRIKSKVVAHLYAGVILLISFVIFNISDLSELGTFIKGMFGVGVNFYNFESIYYLRNSLVVLIFAAVGSSPWLKEKIENLKKGKLNKVIGLGEIIYIMTIFILSVAAIVSSSFNPFIYFRF